MTRRDMLLLAGLLFTLLPAVSADPIETTSTYVTIRPDARLCPSPACGGYWVKRVNLASTRCHDGVYRAECYVAAIDWSASGLSSSQAAAFQSEAAAGRGLIRGTIVARSYSGFGSLGVLAATEGWQAASTKAPSGTFFRLKDNGIRCITTPCFWIHEAKLNTATHTDLSSLDLSPAGASADKVQAAWAALGTTSLLAAGTNVTVSREGPAGDGRRLVASQFYLKVKPDQVCGGIAGTPCPQGEYCELPPGQCSSADLQGVCRPVPAGCTALFDPVCGCDGKTYSNDCYRQQAGVPLAYKGSCR